MVEVMRSLWIPVSCLALLLSSLSLSLADEAKETPEEALKVLGKESSACMRKANDYRVLGLNALKNADAVRSKSHKKLLEEMQSGNADNIETAKDELTNAADDLEDVIEDVERIIAYSVKAEMSSKKAEALCKITGTKGGIDEKYIKNVKACLAAAGKDLAKSEKIAQQLRRDWLEPFFASTSTTSSTTTTTVLTPATPPQ